MLTEDIKTKIKSYILNLFNRYKKEFEYHRSDLTEEIERVKTEIKINNQKLVSYGK